MWKGDAAFSGSGGMGCGGFGLPYLKNKPVFSAHKLVPLRQIPALSLLIVVLSFPHSYFACILLTTRIIIPLSSLNILTLVPLKPPSESWLVLVKPYVLMSSLT